ncbi:hypothetical protein SISNIDRAFT_178475 [Sistotremastrum niveocremeum HHB9708]|uniref:Uncharacterized protein n=1 Tax=Sistotremastrum niveocremeum HHB9708 TaxID=1314777 RepID=A0A164RM31_9AGAM|nr:hypothetical protein SISNIDRAFT_178475 [Sistotremastrum niveocremeum HHB9708]
MRDYDEKFGSEPWVGIGGLFGQRLIQLLLLFVRLFNRYLRPRLSPSPNILPSPSE